MKNEFLLTLFCITIISLVSASLSINITPLGDVYSGETIQRNLTIQTGLELLVHLSNSNVSDKINLSYPKNVLVNGVKIVKVNISVDKYLKDCDQEIIFYANAEGEEQATTSSGSSHKGSSKVYNVVVQIQTPLKQNTTDLIILNEPNITSQNSSKINETKEKEKDKIETLINILILILVIICVVCLRLIFRVIQVKGGFKKK